MSPQSEQFQHQSLENRQLSSVEEAWEWLNRALDEESRIHNEIENVFKTAGSQEEAERIALEKWAPRMDEALEKSSEALALWTRLLKKGIKGE